MKVGDVVDLLVTEVSGYACWGVYQEKIGFSHCVDWSRERPVPDDKCPRVGEVFRVKIFYITDVPYTDLPADVTYGGKFKVDFAGSAELLEE